MRVLFDTNIYISYLISPVNSERTVVQLISAAVADLFTLVVPVDLLTELEETIDRKKHLSRAIPAGELNRFLSILLASAESLPSLPGSQPRVVRDPEDDYLLAACAIANVAVLVSGDRHLLELREHLKRPAIMTPLEFLELITSIGTDQP